MGKSKIAISRRSPVAALALVLGVFALVAPFTGLAQRTLLNGPLQTGSLGTSDQMDRLNGSMMQLVESNAIQLSNARAVATALNRELRTMNLPPINVDAPRLAVTPSLLVGYAPPATTVGFEITDGTHRYCLPCRVGHNSFIRGITLAGQTQTRPQPPPTPPVPSPTDPLPRDSQGSAARSLMKCGGSTGIRVELSRSLSQVGPRFQFDVSNRGRELFFDWVSAQLERRSDDTCVINFRSHADPSGESFPVSAVYDPIRNEFENRLARPGESRSVACGGPSEVDAVFRERVRRCEPGILGLVPHDRDPRVHRMSLPAGGGGRSGDSDGPGVEI